jgi:hypothetical protein
VKNEPRSFSVHRTAGESAHISSSFLAASFLCSQTLSPPAPAPVTRAVSRFIPIKEGIMINSKKNSFPQGWYTAGHGKLWDCDRTYCFIPYETLPPLDMKLFQGKFQWLFALENNLQEEGILPEDPNILAANLNHITSLTEQNSLKLPDSFMTFLVSPHLQNRVPSCTACYLDLSDRIIKSPVEDEDGFLIRFLNDQQTVLAWYLYLNRRGEHCILVASPEFLEEADGETLPRDIFYCAPTFESFIYRFWIENSIWFALRDNYPLTKDQQEYMGARRK